MSGQICYLRLYYGAGYFYTAKKVLPLYSAVSFYVNIISKTKHVGFAEKKRYFQAGGTPEQVINQLSQNYTAVAQMANLLAEWLILAGVQVTDVQAMVENHLKDMILRTFDPKKADTIFTEEGEVSLKCDLPKKCLLKRFNFAIDTCMVNGNDRPSYMAIANLSTGRRISRLFDAEFHNQTNIRCWVSK